MVNSLWEKLRGAHRIELFAALMLAALLALFLLGGGGRDGGTKTALEARVERVLSRVDGAGKVTAMINEDGEGKIAGAVIVAAGLEDVETYLRLQRSVVALLDIEPERVEIIGKKGSFGGGL